MTDLSDEERARRRYAVDFARTNAELSGFALSPEVEALNARFVAGELSTVELVAATRAHVETLPPGPAPVQQYFASIEDLEAVHGRHDG